MDVIGLGFTALSVLAAIIAGVYAYRQFKVAERALHVTADSFRADTEARKAEGIRQQERVEGVRNATLVALHHELELAQRMLEQDRTDYQAYVVGSQHRPSNPQREGDIYVWQLSYAFRQAPTEVLEGVLNTLTSGTILDEDKLVGDLIRIRAAMLAYNDWVRLKLALIPTTVERIQTQASLTQVAGAQRVAVKVFAVNDEVDWARSEVLRAIQDVLTGLSGELGDGDRGEH